MNTFKTIRAGLMATALLAFLSSSAAFGQLQVVAPTAPSGDPVKNAVAFRMTCGTELCWQSNFTVPQGHRLVITQISASIGTSAAFVLVGTLSGQEIRHVFPIPALSSLGGQSAASHNCFVVLDSISLDKSRLVTGTGGIFVGGYLVKM